MVTNDIRLRPEDSAQRWPNLIVTIHSCLHSASIPNLIFDDYALALHGHVAGFAGASFVIPDGSADDALQALKNAGLNADSEERMTARSPRPVFQITIAEDGENIDKHSPKFLFYTQSQVLKEIQPLQTLPEQATKDVVHISSSARWSDSSASNDAKKEDILWVPSLPKLLRAWILLAIDAEVQLGDDQASTHWLNRYTNAMSVLEDKGLWNEGLEREFSGEHDDMKLMADWMHGKVNGKKAWDETIARIQRGC